MQQDRGDSGHAALTAERLRIAEEIMTLLEMRAAPSELWLVGRAAKGHLDADPKLRIRAHCTAPIGEIAAALVDAGYEEPAFQVAESKWGRLDRIRFREQGVECVVTRCPRAQVLDSSLDLFTGAPVPRIDLAGLRRMIDELSRDRP